MSIIFNNTVTTMALATSDTITSQIHLTIDFNGDGPMLIICDLDTKAKQLAISWQTLFTNDKQYNFYWSVNNAVVRVPLPSIGLEKNRGDFPTIGRAITYIQQKLTENHIAFSFAGNFAKKVQREAERHSESLASSYLSDWTVLTEIVPPTPERVMLTKTLSRFKALLAHYTADSNSINPLLDKKIIQDKIAATNTVITTIATQLLQVRPSCRVILDLLQENTKIFEQQSNKLTILQSLDGPSSMDIIEHCKQGLSGVITKTKEETLTNPQPPIIISLADITQSDISVAVAPKLCFHYTSQEQHKIFANLTGFYPGMDIDNNFTILLPMCHSTLSLTKAESQEPYGISAKLSAFYMRTEGEKFCSIALRTNKPPLSIGQALLAIQKILLKHKVPFIFVFEKYFIEKVTAAAKIAQTMTQNYWQYRFCFHDYKSITQISHAHYTLHQIKESLCAKIFLQQLKKIGAAYSSELNKILAEMFAKIIRTIDRQLSKQIPDCTIVHRRITRFEETLSKAAPLANKTNAPTLFATSVNPTEVLTRCRVKLQDFVSLRTEVQPTTTTQKTFP